MSSVVKIGWKNFVMKAKVGKEDKGWGKQVIKKPKFLASGTNSTHQGTSSESVNILFYSIPFMD